MAECTWKICFISLTVLSVLWLIVGAVFIGIHEYMIKSTVEKAVVIKPESSHYKDWTTPPAPVYLEFFVFNITNHLELIANPKAQIKLQQLGPYTYREFKKKRNITFSGDGEQVSYRENKYYKYMSTGLLGSPKDKIYTLNLGYVGISSRFRFSPYPVQRIVDLAAGLVQDLSLFKQLTVEELIWGYHDPVLSVTKKLVEKYLKYKIDDVLGLFAGKNNTDDGLYSIYTGKSDPDLLGKISSWNNESSLRFWMDEYGNSINGSDGTLYPPFVTDENIYFFSSDICRSMYASFDSESHIYDVKLKRFIPPHAAFEKYPNNTDNRPFCTPDVQHCLPSGLLNLTTCRNQPVVSSLPHFYQGSPALLDRFIGLKPDKLQHETFIDIEPMTGTVLEAAKRLQINLYVEPVEGFSRLDGWSSLYFPLAWLNESAAITPSLAKSLRHELYLPVRVTRTIPYVMLTMGGVLLLASLAVGLYMYYGKRRTPEERPGEEESTETSRLLPESED